MSFKPFFISSIFIYLIFSSQLLFANQYHTPPNCWDKERIYHLKGEDAQDILKMIKGAVNIKHINDILGDDIQFSPNQAYAYHLKERDGNYFIRIFTERNYLISFNLTNIHGISEIQWINEKMLLIRVWLGRITGVDLFFDVEAENIVYRMPFRWGQLEFQQWHENCSYPKFQNSDYCLKPCFSIH
ncbi:MAG: hypothetical protein H6755_06780 [Candidatus Omnitrophica bacterium]|nr:hypothetical protein [Candidatus Omnitrophota bacterium]